LHTREINNASKLQTIHYSYDPLIDIQKIPRIKPISIRNLNLVTIGRLVPQKNYPFLFQALSLVSQKQINFTLTILGEGKLEKELVQQALDLNLSKNIIWAGKTKDIQRIMNSSDALIMSSLYEGFGLVVLEAIQLGLPVIAPKRSTFPEVLGSDYPGLFEAESKEEMARLISDLKVPAFISKLSKASISRQSFFTAKKMVEAILDFYEGK